MNLSGMIRKYLASGFGDVLGPDSSKYSQPNVPRLCHTFNCAIAQVLTDPWQKTRREVCLKNNKTGGLVGLIIAIQSMGIVSWVKNDGLTDQIGCWSKIEFD